MTAVLAFYYFCSRWFPPNKKRALYWRYHFLYWLQDLDGFIYIPQYLKRRYFFPQISSVVALLDDSATNFLL